METAERELEEGETADTEDNLKENNVLQRLLSPFSLDSNDRVTSVVTVETAKSELEEGLTRLRIT